MADVGASRRQSGGGQLTRVAAITIGQSPRVDMTDDLRSRLVPSLELVEYGALDDFASLDQVERELAPAPGDEVLVSRMRDGGQATLSGRLIVPLVQERIAQAERDGARAVVLLCTGEFPELEHQVPLVMPLPLFHAVARSLAGGRRIAIMVPEKAQAEQTAARWEADGVGVDVVCASPYKDPAHIARAASSLRGRDYPFVCLDCMGFSLAMRELVRRESGLPVLLPRTLVASVVSELLG